MTAIPHLTSASIDHRVKTLEIALVSKEAWYEQENRRLAREADKLTNRAWQQAFAADRAYRAQIMAEQQLSAKLRKERDDALAEVRLMKQKMALIGVSLGKINKLAVNERARIRRKVL